MIIRTLVAAAALLAAAGAAQAQTVVRDAQTGQLRAPTAAEAQLLEQLRSRSFNPNRGILTGTINPQPIRMPDGSDFLETTEGQLNYSVVVRTANGRLARKCINDPELAGRFVRGEIASFAKNPLEATHER